MVGNPISGGDIQKNIEILIEARIKGQEKINALKKELEGVGATGRETGKSLGGLGNSIENMEGNFSKLTKKLSEQKKELSELKEHSKIESAFAKFTDIDAISKTEAKVGMQEQILDAQKAVELTSKKLNDTKTQLKELMKTAFFNEAWEQFGATQAETIRGLRMSGLQMDNYGNITDMAGKKVSHFWNRLGEGVRKAKPFKPELLGIMFAGQGLNRVFGNLTATAKDWVGVNELLSVSIGTMMLPAMLDLLETVIIPLSEAIMDLPEPLQEFIGGSVLAAEGLGKVIGSVGSIGLALNAAEKFGFLPEDMKNIGGDIGGWIKSGALEKVGKIAGIAVSAYLLLEDLKEGDVLSAIGDAMMIAGFSMAGPAAPWILAAGITLKLLNEGVLSSIAVKLFDTLGVIMEWLADTMYKIFRLDFANIDWQRPLNIFDDMDEVAAKMVLSGEAKSNALINRIGGIEGAIETLTNAHKKALDDIENKYEIGIIGSAEEYEKAIEKVNSEYNILNTINATELEKHYDNILVKTSNWVDNLRAAREEIDAMSGGEKAKKSILSGALPVSSGTAIGIGALPAISSAMSSQYSSSESNIGIGTGAIPALIPSLADSTSNILKGGLGSLISLLQGRAVGGNIGTTGPYLLHAGETVIPKNQSSEGVTLVVTYNVNVSDKREFEQLIERNNRQLTQEVRRLIQ